MTKKIHNHACVNCFSGKGECLGNCNITDLNNQFDGVAAVVQEYFPEGGRNWDEVQALCQAIALGKVPGLSFTNQSDPYKTLDSVARPAIKWINDHCNPHAVIIIDGSSAVLYSGEKSIHTEEFIKD